MGVSEVTHVGAYIKLPEKVSVSNIKLVIACPNVECDRHGIESSNVYCSACGDNLEKVDTIYTEKISVYQAWIRDMYEPIDDEIFEELFYNDGCIEYGYLVGDDGNTSIGMSDDIECEITEIDMSNCINAFRERYGSEILKISTFYPDNIFQIKFGVLHYWS